MKPVALGTTAYAILGLLAVQEGTAYELAKRMERNYRFIWPRAESKLYDQVKTLVAAKAATATKGKTGKRPHTTYRITAAGRKMLSAWVRDASTGGGPTLEFEALLKVTYADFGEKDDLLALLARVEENARQMLALGTQLGLAYARGDVELSERSHVNALVWHYLHAQYGAILKWSRWAREEVAHWPDTRPSKNSVKRAREIFRKALKGSAIDE